MNDLCRSLLALSLLVTADGVHAQSMTTVLSIPPGDAVAGTSVELRLIAFNEGTAEGSFSIPAVMPASLIIGGESWSLEMRADSPSRSTVAPGGFIARPYCLDLPNGAAGLGVIEVALPDSSILSSAIEVAGATAGAAGGDGVPPPPDSEGNVARHAAMATNADVSIFGRTFAGRLQAHESMYFVYGSGPQAAKFQFSFKYKLADLGDKNAAATLNSLQLGYTERSLWDVDSVSSPFYDTSYMPELFWEWIKFPAKMQSGLSWNGFQLGVKHESNGKGGDDSRSVNIAYLRTPFFVGPVDGWHLILFPEVWTYLGGGEDIAEYRGYGQVRGSFGQAKGPLLAFAVMAGKGLHHGSVQLGMTYPVHVRFLGSSMFVLAQYFNGYGESILSYDRKSESIRLGIALVR
jgi:outer membrane phospholipase A